MSLTDGTVPVPNALIDRVMPTLRDTELRVLVIVVRQTLGWQVGNDPRQRKERDWLTQSQLMRRTGRASGAVSRAVDALVRRGLIDVLDSKGNPLVTPAERRRCLGRLYYRLAGGAGTDAPPYHKREYAKPHTTTSNGYKIIKEKKPPVDNSVENQCVVLRQGWVHASDIRGGERRSGR